MKKTILKLAFAFLALNTIAPSVMLCAEPEKQVVKNEESKPSADSILLGCFLIGCLTYSAYNLLELAISRPSAYERQQQRIYELATALQLAQTPRYLWPNY